MGQRIAMRIVMLAFVSLFISLPAFGGPFTGIYFFGDSLSDTGNVLNVTGGAVPPPPYAGGGFSNGNVYADVLAADLGFASTPSTSGGNNFAYGGARTRYHIGGIPGGSIQGQVAQYIQQPNTSDPHALYVVWAGASNLQDNLLDALASIPPSAQKPGINGTVDDIIGMLTDLYNDGARNFLVPNVPNLGLTPRVAALGPAAQTFAGQLSQGFNALLAAQLGAFDALHMDDRLIQFNTFKALNDLVSNPAFNATERCYKGDDITFAPGGPAPCSTPESFVFWDGIHPTAAAHGILGDLMFAAVVPEPGTLGVLGIALAGLGWSRRRK